MSQPMLTITELGVGYKKEHGVINLFEGLNLQLNAGELVCFMGPNGVGKSTLLRTLAGLHPALSGQVHANQGSAMPDQIAVVLTDRVSSLNMTVDELITYGRYPYLGWTAKVSTQDLDIIEKSVDATNTRQLLRKKIYELSDGQMQLVMLARALAQDTPIILLDEPTAHLDLNNRVEIMNLLRNLTRTTNKAILLATHELDLALQTADSIWLAGNDKKIQTGFPEDLVLNGVFDEVFRFKGFDLRTGKVLHEVIHSLSLKIEGSGHHLLWTKNALERCGFKVDESSAQLIKVRSDKGEISWSFRDYTVHSIKELIDILNRIVQ